MKDDFVQAMEQSAEELNLRLFCEMAMPDEAGRILWIESITLTDIIYPERKKGLLAGAKKVIEFIYKHIFKRKKGLLWRLQNSLQD